MTSHCELHGIYINTLFHKHLYTLGYSVIKNKPNDIGNFWYQYHLLNKPILDIFFRVNHLEPITDKSYGRRRSYKPKISYTDYNEVYQVNDYINEYQVKKLNVSTIEVRLQLTSQIETWCAKKTYISLGIYCFDIETYLDPKQKYIIASQAGTIVRNVPGNDIYPAILYKNKKLHHDPIPVKNKRGKIIEHEVKHITFGGKTSIMKASHNDDDDETNFELSKLLQMHY